MHPSELPSFDSLVATRKQVRSQTARAIASITLAALFVGGAGLASTRNSPPPNQAMPAQIVTTLNALPQVARAAAQRTVLLTITTPGHVRNVAAMALPHNLAVTTTPIARKALITGSIPSHLNFRVTWVGRDETLGFTIVRLGIKVPSSSFAPLPASTSVVAVAPVTSTQFAPVASQCCHW